MTTWTALLDDYEATIAAAEASLAAGDEPSATTWVPPLDVPTAAPSDEHRDRFTRLQERAAACAAHLQAGITTAGEDLETVRRTGVAARAYDRVGHLTG